MQPFVAQLTETEVCGGGLDSSWLCLYVLRTTGDDLLARAAATVGMILVIILVLIGAYLVARLLRRLVNRFAERMEQKVEDRLERSQSMGAIPNAQRYRTRRLQRLKAITGVLRGVVAVVVWMAAILLVIAVAGIRLQPILAGAGLVGIVVGFGAQQLVRDVLAGIAMLIEDQYGVGDWIEIEGVVGEVERVGLRATAMRDIDGTVHHVLNGAVQRVGNLSQEWARARFDVPVALDADVPNVKALIHQVATELAADPIWGQDIIGEPEIWGVQDFGPQGITIRVTFPTKPLRNWDVTRQLRERLKLGLEQAGVRMPSQLIELGGQPAGHAVRLQDLRTDGEVPRRHEPARAEDRENPLTPGGWRPAPAPAGDDTDESRAQTLSRQAADDHLSDDNPTGDLTTELRIDQGPRARPD